MAKKENNSSSQQKVNDARKNSGSSGSDNKIQDAYDNIYNQQGRNGSEQDGRSLYEREVKPDKDGSEPLSPQGQAQTDNKSADSESAELYSPGADTANEPLKSKVKGAFSGKKKYGWIGGGFIGLVIAGILTLFPVLGPIHIFSNLFDHNFEMNDSLRRNRTSRIIRSIFIRNADTTRQLADTPFKLKADLLDFEKFEARMNAKGWQFEYADPQTKTRPIGLIKPDGTRANFDDPDVRVRAEINDLVKDTVPAWRMNKRVRTRLLVSTFTGPRRAFSWTNLFKRDRAAEPDFEAAKYRKESGLDRTTIDADRTVRHVDADGNDLGDSTNSDALDKTIEAKLDGATDAEALRVGAAETSRKSLPGSGAGRTSVIFGTVVVGCIAYSVNQNELAVAYERYTAALRLAATFMLGTNEIQQGGNIDVGEVGQFFREYNNGEPTKIDMVDEDGNPVLDENGNQYDYQKSVGTFAGAAAWQRATGDEVTGSEINEEYRVIPSGSDGYINLDSILSGTIGALGSIGATLANLPGFGLICQAIGSSIGFVIGLALDFVEGLTALAACIGSGGVGCVTLAKFLVVEAIFEASTRIISAASSSFAGFLTSDPAQATAVLDQGLNLTSSEENRAAAPVDSREYNMQVAAFKSKQNLNKSFAERYFDIDNPNSLATHLATAKMSFNIANLNPSSLIASLFSMPGSSLVAVFNSGNVYAQADLSFDNYGFQKYSFDNNYKEVDPFDNAEEVADMIDADTEVASSADEVDVSGNLDRDFATLCMGYDPNSGLVDKSVAGDMLPMFSDPESLGAAEARRRNELFNALCIEAANSPGQIDEYSQIGRFVDDIELISSMIELTGEPVPPLSRQAPTAPGGGGSGGTTPSPDPDPTPPPICDPNTPPGEPCIE